MTTVDISGSYEWFLENYATGKSMGGPFPTYEIAAKEAKRFAAGSCRIMARKPENENGSATALEIIEKVLERGDYLDSSLAASSSFNPNTIEFLRPPGYNEGDSILLRQAANVVEELRKHGFVIRRAD